MAEHNSLGREQLSDSIREILGGPGVPAGFLEEAAAESPVPARTEAPVEAVRAAPLDEDFAFPDAPVGEPGAPLRDFEDPSRREEAAPVMEIAEVAAPTPKSDSRTLPEFEVDLTRIPWSHGFVDLLGPIGSWVSNTYGVEELPPRIPAARACECKVVVKCVVGVCTITYNPKALRDIKAADQENALRKMAQDEIDKCRKSDLKECSGHFNIRTLKKEVHAALAEIKEKQDKAPPEKRQAFVVSPAPKIQDVKVECLVEKGDGGEVLITLCVIHFVILPEGAGAVLRRHEKGHRQLFDHYFCVILKRFLEAKIHAQICNKPYKSMKSLEDEVWGKLQGTGGHKSLMDEFNTGMTPFPTYNDRYDSRSKKGNTKTEKEQEAAENETKKEMDNDAKFNWKEIFEKK